jgi:hypothetical protein
MEMKTVWISWNCVKFHKILSQTDAKKQTKKLYSYKKYKLSRSVWIGQDSSNRWHFAVPIYSDGFGQLSWQAHKNRNANQFADILPTWKNDGFNQQTSIDVKLYTTCVHWLFFC